MNRAAFPLLCVLSVCSSSSYGVEYSTAGTWEHGSPVGFCDAKAAEWNSQHGTSISYDTSIGGPAAAHCLQQGTGNIKASVYLQCPPGYSNLENGVFTAICTTNIPDDKTPPPNRGDGCSAGNPITLAGQQKFQKEIDFVSSIGEFPLTFTRYFNSAENMQGDVRLWQHYYEIRLNVVTDANGFADFAALYNADGRVDNFQNGSNFNDWESPTGRPVKLSIDYIVPTTYWDVYFNVNKFELEHENGLKYEFDQSGRVTKITHSSGEFHTIQYNGNSGQVQTVTHSNGDHLDFIYNTGTNSVFPESVQYNDQSILTYEFTPSYNVSKVTYEDSAGNDTFIEYEYDLAGLNTGDTTDNEVDILLKKKDEEGQYFSTWDYDNNKITSYRGNNKEETEVEFVDGLTTKVTNAFDQVTTYKYTEIGGMRKLDEVDGESTTNCVASNTSYEYDVNGSVDKIHYNSDPDPSNNNIRPILSTTDYTYTDGRLTEVKYAEGSTDETQFIFAWNGPLQQKSFQSGNGQSIDYAYTAKGRIDQVTVTDLTTHTDPYATNNRTQVTDYSYVYYDLTEGVDPSLNRIKTIQIDGPRPSNSVNDTTTLSYDTDGRLTTITDAASHTTQINSFNWRGQPKEVVDANNVKTLFEYNFRGWLTKVTLKSPSAQAGPDRVTSIDYYKNGLLKKVTLPEGDEIDYEFNDARHLEKITNELSEVMDMTPNLMGDWTLTNTREIANGPLTRKQERTFDEKGRLMDIKGANGQRTHFDYDRRGNLAEIQEIGTGETLITDLVYDKLNRLYTSTKTPVSITEEGIEIQSSEVIEYRYQNGHLHKVIDPNGLETLYTVDGFGNRIKISSPDTGITTFWYDEANNLTKRIDNRNVTTDYVYDALNRLTEINYPANAALNVRYYYDEFHATDNPYAKGRLTRITDASGTHQYFYDHAGNIIKTEHTVQGQVYLTEYQYNLNDELTKVVYPSGRIVDYERIDSPNRISAIKTKADAQATTNTITSAINYYPFGPVKSLTYGNSLTKTITRDLDYRVSSIVVPNVMDLSYGYTDFNDIASITDQLTSGNSQVFEYDELFRLTKATGAYGTIDYHYDLTGNRSGQKQDLNNEITDSNYAYDTGTHQLDKITATMGSYQTLRKFVKDAVGNTTRDQRINLEKGYTYAENNRLTEYRENGNLHASYLYNALGQRVQKQLSHGTSLTLHYIYDLEGRLIAEYGSNNRLIREYLYLNGEPIALINQQ